MVGYRELGGRERGWLWFLPGDFGHLNDSLLGSWQGGQAWNPQIKLSGVVLMNDPNPGKITGALGCDVCVGGGRWGWGEMDVR